LKYSLKYRTGKASSFPVSLSGYNLKNQLQMPNSVRVRLAGDIIWKRGMKLRRLEIRLPKNHPIFDYPVRSRTLVAMLWMDIGIKLSNIESRLDLIESKLENPIIRKEEEAPQGVEARELTSEEKDILAQKMLNAFG
jgi:hypothetical protein